MDLVSIIIPVFNTGEYFRACMESVLNQTYPNLEVVVVDDHSTDPLTLNLMHEFAQKDSRVKLLLSDENHGPSYCRNKGVENAAGKYFMFLDSDDLLVPDCIERTHQAIEDNKTDFVVCNVKNFRDDDSVPVLDDFLFNLPENETIKTKDFILSKSLIGIPIIVYGKLFNLQKYRLANVHFREDMRFAEDHEWTYRLFCGMDSFTVLNFFALQRRLRKGSLIHSVTEDKLLQSLEAQYLKSEVLKQYGYFELYKDKFFEDSCDQWIHTVLDSDNAETRCKLSQVAAQNFQKMGYSIKTQPTYFDYLSCKLKYKLCKILRLKHSKMINKVLCKTYKKVLKEFS